jgi:hypothetical protein
MSKNKNENKNKNVNKNQNKNKKVIVALFVLFETPKTLNFDLGF